MAFVPLAMARGYEMAVIEVVVWYQLLWCFFLTNLPFQHPYEAPSSGPVRIVKLMCVLCHVLPRPYLPQKEGAKWGRRIEGRELDQLVS